MLTGRKNARSQRGSGTDPLAHAEKRASNWTPSAGLPIDPSAQFPDGTSIDGIKGVRTLVSSRRDQYVETFTAKLLTYALGRLVDYRDQPAIRKIAREAAAQDHRWSAIISGIVKSAPFRMAATPALAAAH
mgnify:CR=1 FL=1